jgi:hypothetical protein
MLGKEAPASTILVDAQSMAGRDMPSEHLAAPPTFQTNDIIPVNGSPDRDGRCLLISDFWHRFSEANERMINGRNQGRQLVGPDLVSPNVGGDNRRSEFSIK